MWLFNVFLLFSLLALISAQYPYQYYRNRAKRLPSFDSANSGGGGGDGDGDDVVVGEGKTCGSRAGGISTGGATSGGGGRGNARGGAGAGGRGGAAGRGGASQSWCGEPRNSIQKMTAGDSETAKQRSSGIAMQAAQEAKKANEDMAPAVKAAADKIKCEYADKAAAAANAADAVLYGKGQLLNQLEAEVCNARMMLQQQIQKVGTYNENLQLAIKSRSQLKRQLKVVSSALKGAKEKLTTAEMVSTVWAKSVAEGTAILEAAQKRINILVPIRNEVQQDREKTLKAAASAAQAAQEAKDRIDHAEKGETSSSESSECGRPRRAWQYDDMLYY